MTETDIQKIKGILRANSMHEAGCATKTLRDMGHIGLPEMKMWDPKPCDCWLSEEHDRPET